MEYSIKKAANFASMQDDELTINEAEERYIYETLEKIIKNKLANLDINTSQQLQAEVLKEAMLNNLCEVSVSDSIINNLIVQTFAFNCKCTGLINMLPRLEKDGLRRRVVIFE